MSVRIDFIHSEAGIIRSGSLFTVPAWASDRRVSVRRLSNACVDACAGSVAFSLQGKQMTACLISWFFFSASLVPMSIFALIIKTNEYSCFAPIHLKAVNAWPVPYTFPSCTRYPEELLLSKLLVGSPSVEFI